MNAKSRLKDQAGFTLVELLIIVAIIAILASIALAKYSEASELTKTKAWEYNSSIVNKAYATYRALAGNSYVPADKETGISFLGAFLNSTLKNGDLPGGTCTWTRSSTDYANATCVAAGAATAATLYSSTFANDSGVGILRGAGWSVSGGSLIATGNGKDNTNDEQRAVFSGTYGTNYDITANVNLDEGRGYGIYYHITDAANPVKDPTTANISGYVFQYDAGWNGGSFIIRQVDKGTEVSTPLAQVKIASVMPAGFKVYDTPHQVVMSVSGATTTVKVDGMQVLNYTNPSFTYTAGSVGARTWDSKSVVNFQEVSVVAK